MEHPETNPYAAPAETEVSPGPTEFHPGVIREVSFGNAFARWMAICTVAAAPSFFFGYMIAEQKVTGVIAMLVGVVLFALGYAAIDIGPKWRSWMSQKVARYSIITTYSIRIVASIAFPLAVMNDVMIGSLSVGCVGFVLGGAAFEGMDEATVLFVFLATILQGVLLNVELLLIGAIVYAILSAWHRNRPSNSTVQHSFVRRQALTSATVQNA